MSTRSGKIRAPVAESSQASSSSKTGKTNKSAKKNKGSDNKDTKTFVPLEFADNNMDNPVEEDPCRIPLSFLSQMITPFNGDTKDLQTFLQNANNALEICAIDQKLPLTLLIFSKVSSDVRTKINMSSISTFTELRSKLKLIFQPSESYSYLMEQLETMKQKTTESVKEYYVRLDNITTKCLTATEQQTKDRNFTAEVRVINRIALRRFTHHCIPEISQILRHKDFNSINEEMSLACEEEAYLLAEARIKRMTINSTSSNRRFCNKCRVDTHNTRDCRRVRPRNMPSTSNNYNSNNNGNYHFISSNNQNYSNQNPNRSYMECNYCHYRGHTEETCRRKNQRNQMNPNPRIAQERELEDEYENTDYLNFNRFQSEVVTANNIPKATTSSHTLE